METEKRSGPDIILKLDKVCFSYEDGTEALKGIDLQVSSGEKVAIMGANGSGKSTLFLTLNGIRKPSSGQVFLKGAPIDYTKKGLFNLRKQIGIVFQDPDIQLFSASVVQEISFGILNLGASEEDARKRVHQIMEELNISPFCQKPTHFLSGGQKKRVSIADILVMDPEVMILDEPAASLDPKHARMIDGIIDKLSKRGITVILSTHDVERALIWADRVVLLDEGRVVAEGPPEEIFQKEELLDQTNLEKPTILKIFDALCQAEILDKERKIPRKSEDLENYIKERGKGYAKG